jgi:SAM-dependent methyltransferase
MQAYGRVFARLYNQRWGFFARQIGPRLIEFCESLPLVATNRRVLDLCCGAGHLATQFLARGYTVVGLDLSWDMLSHAREAVSPFLATGRVLLVQGDAGRFALPGDFGFAVSTFDALNHLPSLTALEACFAATWHSLAFGGYFVFDLNTRCGFRRWNGISVDDSAAAMIVNRGIYGDGSARAGAAIWFCPAPQWPL